MTAGRPSDRAPRPASAARNSRRPRSRIAGAVWSTARDNINRWATWTGGLRGAARGIATLMSIEPEHGSIEIGHIWLSPQLQRTRQATEAIFLMARYAFDELGNRRLEWKCNADNAASRRAAERYGFVFEGIFRQHRVIKGRNRDTAWYSITDGEWPMRRAAFEAWLSGDNFDSSGRQRRSLANLRVGNTSVRRLISPTDVAVTKDAIEAALERGHTIDITTNGRRSGQA